MTPTPVYESYWYFAAERQAIYERRLADPAGPWSSDPILNAYRFTNAFRAADRVSQYLIRDVQYREDRSQAPGEIFLRTLLFKLFNKIETWELVESQLGPLSWQSCDFNAIDQILDQALGRGARIYSAAYIMPSPQMGHVRKHKNHLAVLARMMDDGLPGQVERARSLSEVYDLLRPYPGLGPFLAFQFTIDLNYSNLLSFEEKDFVVAGPGALDGIAKCFEDTDGRSAEEVIAYMVAVQKVEFDKRGLSFNGLFGRDLQPIDCQNLFCEISKYSRVSHPEIRGINDRSRIKQGYRSSVVDLNRPFFPPRWGLNPQISALKMGDRLPPKQGRLF